MDQVQEFHRLSSQVGILYRQSLDTLLYPVPAAAAIGVLLWDASDRRHLLVWVSAVALYTSARYLLVWCYGRAAITPGNVNLWLDLYIAGAFVSGLIWGTGLVFLLPYAPERVMEFTVHSSLAMLVACGLVAGAVVAYSVCLPVILFYAVPALVLPALRLIALGDAHAGTLGGFLMLYLCFIAGASYRLNNLYGYYIGLEYRTLRLCRDYEALRVRSKAGGRTESA